ncbi:TerB family tellurite resistance protein [Chitinophaga cymbidii]|nr:TerB family tellurite resistance protein [Chitinophaga cymbidii]
MLNIQKLNQLKSLLEQMYKGYTILSTGYNTIKDLSEGNFSLHKTFLDGLLSVSPTVKKYKRVVDIVSLQQQLLRHSKEALRRYTIDQLFKEGELRYLEEVYARLIEGSLNNLDALLMVITANQLRMNDAERLSAIDRIYDDMKRKVDFSNYFQQKITLLAAQRNKAKSQYQSLQEYFEMEK